MLKQKAGTEMRFRGGEERKDMPQNVRDIMFWRDSPVNMHGIAVV